MTEFWQAFANALSPERGEALLRLASLTEKTAQRMNITAHKSFSEIFVYHILDSLSVSDQVRPGMRVCDVGTGGGFPGLVLAILHPDARFTLLDATEKKVRAVDETAKGLGLQNVCAVCGRAEELGRGELRESFDLTVSRAVAPLSILAELCLPLLKTGGAFCAMKGRRVKEEQAQAREILRILQAKERLFRLEDAKIDALLERVSVSPALEDLASIRAFCEMERYTLVYEKSGPTPPAFPRSFAKMKKANPAKAKE